MGTTFEGATRPDMQCFAPEALDSIILGLNLRHDLGDLEDFARRIAAERQLQPGIVRRDNEGNPVLVAGYRRLAAIKLINTDPAAFGAPAPMPFLAVFRRMNEDDSMMVNLRENLDRKELSDVDLAHAAVSLEQLGWDRKKIAEAMRCTPAHVGQLLSLLELPGKVVTLVHHGELPTSAALALKRMRRARIDSLVADLESGKIKPQTVIRAAREEKRSEGKKIGRSLAEVKAKLEEFSTDRATDFLSWIDGEPKITNKRVAEIFAETDG